METNRTKKKEMCDTYSGTGFRIPVAAASFILNETACHADQFATDHNDHDSATTTSQ